MLSANNAMLNQDSRLTHAQALKPKEPRFHVVVYLFQRKDGKIIQIQYWIICDLTTNEINIAKNSEAHDIAEYREELVEKNFGEKKVTGNQMKSGCLEAKFNSWEKSNGFYPGNYG